MKKDNPHYKISELCRLFQLSVSIHYYHLNQEISASEQPMIDEIKAIVTEHHHVYGKRRMKVALNNKGLSIGVYKTATLMKKPISLPSDQRKDRGMTKVTRIL